MKKQLFFAVIAIAFILSGCSTKKSTAVSNPDSAEQETNIIEKKWRLIELYGQAIPATINGKTPFIEFFEENNRYSASAGCNGLGGTYSLEKHGRIKFSQGMSTMMACENMEIETKFKDVLAQADNYTFSGKTLSLNKARMAPLARFQLIEKEENVATNSSDTTKTQIPVMDNSRTSVDWTGHYRGTLPCADCEGIKVAVDLKDDNTYTIFRKYQGKETNGTTTTGKFNWTPDGNKIVLDNNQMIQVGENQLFWLDTEGNRIMGDLELLYQLEKQGVDAIKEKYWKLVSINDTPVAVVGNREANIILKEDGQFKGHGGCNGLFGTYIVSENNKIRFQEIGSTEMMCDAIKTESKLIKALQTADNYLIKNNTFFLLKGNSSPLATFEAVYF